MKILFFFLSSCASQLSNFTLKKTFSFYLDNQKKILKRISWYSNLNLIEDLYYITLDDTLTQYLTPVQEHLFASCLEKQILFIYSTSHLVGEKSFLERNFTNAGTKIFKLNSMVSVFKSQTFYEDLNIFRYQIFGLCSMTNIKNILLAPPGFQPISF